jgi:hypothetical protein
MAGISATPKPITSGKQVFPEFDVILTVDRR